MQEITITDIMMRLWKERAIYTAEERGIPLFSDGLKPVQRFLISKALKIAKTKYEKVATIATIATEGYHHGEQSAAQALVNMAADFSNNLPLFEGDGNFGNVLNPAAGAPRYIYARLTPLFEYLFKDMDLCSKHEDPDHIPPKYYLPIIPIELLNGVKGIATGYATNIPPHDPVSIIDWLIARTKSSTVSVKIKPKYYSFNGTVEEIGNGYEIKAPFTVTKSRSHIKVHITDLPRGYTCNTYDTYLRKLQGNDKIESFANNSRMNNFDYQIVIGTKSIRNTDEESIRKLLKLSTTHTWNLTTISNEGKIQEWQSVSSIMEEFYRFRLPYVKKRIEVLTDSLKKTLQYNIALQKFCTDVIEEKFSFKKLSEDNFRKILKETYGIPDEKINTVINMPVRNFTADMVKKLEKNISEIKKQAAYYSTTTEEKEYAKDLQELKDKYLDYIKTDC